MIKLKLRSESFSNAAFVKDIRFPKSEIPKNKGQTVIITSLQPEDADKFDKGDYVYCEEVDENYCFEVIFKYVVKKVSDIDQLTQPQADAIKRLGGTTVITLQKTKYERPYKLSYIKANYPEKVYQKLVKDRCHAWRARTGIDMIHLEPDADEQKRTCSNWRLLPNRYKSVSDQKSIEFFGCDNLSHEKMLAVDKLKKVFSGIHYGWRNPKTGEAVHDEKEFKELGGDVEDIWRLGTPEQTIKAEVGNCYDTVAISISMLKLSPVSFRIFYMFCDDSEFDGKHYSEGPTHTVCIYQNTYDNEWYWLEGSWGQFRNNDWHSTDRKSLVKWIATAMANSAKRPICVNELSGYPKYGCNMVEFETFCRKGTKVMTCKPEKK